MVSESQQKSNTPKRDQIDVVGAANRIAGFVHRTPVLQSTSFNEIVGRPVYFKCENFQKVGAFKARGALSALMELPASVETVVTHSSGNHGAALAWAARQLNKTAYVICPTDASRFKRDAIRRYGGVLVDCGPELHQRESALQSFMQERKATFVPPYDHPVIIAGQGTATLEFLEEVPDIREIWVPIGGGGLAAGTVVAADGRCTVVGCEPELARDAHDSLLKGHRLPPLPPKTIADGLRSSLGELNFEILHRESVPVKLVNEDEIRAATTLIWQILKIIIEPSSAVPVAALLKEPRRSGEPVGVILSGGNVQPKLPI